MRIWRRGAPRDRPSCFHDGINEKGLFDINLHNEPLTAPRPHPTSLKNKGLGGGAGRFHRSAFAQLGMIKPKPAAGTSCGRFAYPSVFGVHARKVAPVALATAETILSARA